MTYEISDELLIKARFLENIDEQDYTSISLNKSFNNCSKDLNEKKGFYEKTLSKVDSNTKLSKTLEKIIKECKMRWVKINKFGNL